MCLWNLQNDTMNSTTTTLLRPSLFLLHHNPTSSTKLICCSSSSRNQSFIPKLQPFSRTKLDRLAKDLPLIEKSEKDLLGAFRFLCSIFVWCRKLCFWFLIFIYLPDYCSILEGDESYSCWQAYFELKDLQVCNLFLLLCFRYNSFKILRFPCFFSVSACFCLSSPNLFCFYF